MHYLPCTTFNPYKRQKIASTPDDQAAESTSSLSCNIFENMNQSVDSSFFEKESLETITKSVGVTLEKSKEIENETKQQGNSQMWYLERSKRLTSSLFGQVVRRRDNIYPKSILEQIQRCKEGKRLKTAAIQWGVENEKIALAMYKEKLDNMHSVIECGLMINPKWPWLGASPDGLVSHEGKLVGGVEIKCPYSKREMTIADACKSKTFFLKESDSGPQLKESHAYFYQCQGLMNIVGISWLDFVVYTEKEVFVQRLNRDSLFWEKDMLPKLASFYKTYILNKI